MKTTKKENIRLEVTYGGYYNKGILSSEETQISDLEYLKHEITDHMPDSLNMEVIWDSVEYCSFCNSSWETEDTGEPICCNEAIKAWEEENENNK